MCLMFQALPATKDIDGLLIPTADLRRASGRAWGPWPKSNRFTPDITHRSDTPRGRGICWKNCLAVGRNNPLRKLGTFPRRRDGS